MKDFYNLLSKIRSLSVEFCIIVSGQALMMIGTLVLMRVMTSRLSVQEFATSLLGTAFSSILTMLFGAPIGSAVLRFSSLAKSEGQTFGLFEAVKLLFKYFTIITIGVGLLSSLLISYWSPSYGVLVLLCALWGCSMSLAAPLDSYLMAERKRVTLAICKAMDIWLRLFLGMFFIKLFGASATWAILGFLVGSLVTLFFRVSCLPPSTINHSSTNIDSNSVWINRILKFSAPSIIWGAAFWLFTSVDRWSLSIYCTDYDVAMYGVVYQLGFSCTILLGGLVHQLVQPIIYERHTVFGSNESRKTLNIYLCILAIGFSFIWIGSYIFNKFVFHLFSDKQYSAGAELLPIFVAAGAIYSLAQATEMFCYLRLESKRLLLPKTLIPLITCVSYLLVAKDFGVSGIAFSLLSSCSLFFIWTLFYVKR